MNRGLLIAILILAVFGLADSLYLAHAALTDTPLSCGVGTLDGCNTVAQSPYSNLFGIPLALYGVAFYAATGLLAGAMLAGFRRLAIALLWVSALGLAASVYFIYLQVFKIQAVCIYCLASFLLSSFIFAAAWLLDRRPQTTVLP